MARRHELEKVIAELKDEMAWWDAELEAADVEDATEWEHFPEMERVMYALAERMVEWESLVDDPVTAAEVAERDELIEFVEAVEENARAEIQAFGFVAIMDDLEELGDFAIVDRCIHDLDDLFAVGRIGGAEVYEYNELMREFDSLMNRY